jgi:ankyrin repeat protein
MASKASKKKGGDSGAFKLVVVVMIGAVVVGGLALIRKSLGTDAPTPTPTAAVDAAGSVEVIGVAPLDASPTASSSALAAADASAPPTSADRTALLEATSLGDLAKVQELAGKGVPVAGTLERAARSGNLALVTWLFDHGVDPHEDENDTVSPLLAADKTESIVNLLLARGVKEPTIFAAAHAGAPNAVNRALAKKKTDANAKSDTGEPVLHAAIANNAGATRLALVDTLLKAGADPNATFEKMPILGAAVSEVVKKSEGAMDVVKQLLVKGATLDVPTLVMASGTDKADHDALQEVFLGHKVSPDAAYMMIMNERDPKMIARIGAKGVNWTSENPNVPPTPPLVLAARDQDVARVNALLAAGAPVDRAGEGDETPLFAAIDSASADSAEAATIVAALLAKGANPNKRTAGGRRPLHAAAEKGEEGIVKALLAKGAHIDDEVNGTTALEAAESNGNSGVAKFLLSKGAKKKKPD